MGPIGLPAGFVPRALLQPQPLSNIPVSVVSLSTLLVSVTVSVFMEQGRYPCAQPPIWRTRG